MFQVKWSVSASKQRIDILNFWIDHNKSEVFSRKLLKETLYYEKLILKSPYLGIKTDFQGVRRVIVLENFSLYYTVLKNLIEIVAFRDNRRNPENLEI